MQEDDQAVEFDPCDMYLAAKGKLDRNPPCTVNPASGWVTQVVNKVCVSVCCAMPTSCICAAQKNCWSVSHFVMTYGNAVTMCTHFTSYVPNGYIIATYIYL